MKKIRFLLLGVFVGILFTKSEVVSWYRIYEMFKFKSFHMYGIIGSAIVLGIIIIQVIKRFNIKTRDGLEVSIQPKDRGWKRYLFGGTVFGLGWAITGACPGPMFALVGNGFVTVLLMILSAVFGTFIYGVLKKKLPH